MSGAARRAEPGQTWWGRAWVEALEQRARLDPNRLPRGRDYARGGSVGKLVLAPGEVRAQVQGRKTVPYEVRIRVRRFADDEWDRVLEAISAQLGHAAAMLDGELPPEVAADVATAPLRTGTTARRSQPLHRRPVPRALRDLRARATRRWRC